MSQENMLGYELPLHSLLNDTYKLTGYMAASELSIVYLGCNMENGDTVAIKEFYPKALVMRDIDQKTVISRKQSAKAHIDIWREAFRREALLLRRLEHANIVRWVNDFEQNGTLYIVTAYCRGQTLEHHIQANHPPSKAEWIRKTLIPLLDAIRYMHGQGIIHRDLKPGNVVIGEDGSPQLIDFGSALEPNMDRKYPIMTSEGFSPLELYSDKSAQGMYSDMFSFAAIVYYVLSGQAPADIAQRLIVDKLPSVRALHRSNGIFCSLVIMWGLAVNYKRRCPSLRIMKTVLYIEYYRLKLQELPKKRLKESEKSSPRL